LRERGDATVILVTRGVEHDRVDPGGLGPLGDRRTDLLGGLDVGTRTQPVGDGAFARRRGDQGVALRVVDDEGVGVVQAAEDLQPRARLRPDDLLAKARVTLAA